MKKIWLILFVAALLPALAACGGKTGTGRSEASAEATTSAVIDEEAAHEPADAAGQAENGPADGSKTLVVFFSATGVTKGVAEKIAAIENADLYEIRAAREYTAADLNWHDGGSRTTLEQNDKSVRPEIGSERITLAGYERIYIGYPIWWGEEPRIMDTFVESYDFTGVTVIPFCTSGGSGVGRSGQNLADNAGNGNWLDGRRFGGAVTDAELQNWIDSLR